MDNSIVDSTVGGIPPRGATKVKQVAASSSSSLSNLISHNTEELEPSSSDGVSQALLLESSFLESSASSTTGDILTSSSMEDSMKASSNPMMQVYHEKQLTTVDLLGTGQGFPIINSTIFISKLKTLDQMDYMISILARENYNYSK